ncbi:serine/threonine-protein phosphatase [Pelomyxa schiedti]|nr:serine/threonine-protein phosphatase [Pelomyxa schiedti]
MASQGLKNPRTTRAKLSISGSSLLASNRIQRHSPISNNITDSMRIVFIEYVVDSIVYESTREGIVTRQLTSAVHNQDTLVGNLPIEPLLPHKCLAKKILDYHVSHFLPHPDYVFQPCSPSHRWSGAPVNANDIIQLIDFAFPILQSEPTLLNIPSPVILFGDLHGNYKDLRHFIDTFGVLNMELVTSKLLFLGDYVDKGPHGIETITLLLCLKVLYPTEVFLLRGNHETQDVGHSRTDPENFVNQCLSNYGMQAGRALCLKFYHLFDILPLAAVVDKEIFCVHGGLPRCLRQPGFCLLPHIQSITRPPNTTDQCIFDLLWADPVSSPCSGDVDFAPSPRDPDMCIAFGKRAIMDFFQQSGCTHIVRGHEFTSQGISISKGATTLTVFSSSHFVDATFAAAIIVYEHTLTVVLLDGKKIINSSQARPRW